MTHRHRELVELVVFFKDPQLGDRHLQRLNEFRAGQRVIIREAQDDNPAILDGNAYYLASGAFDCPTTSCCAAADSYQI